MFNTPQYTSIINVAKAYNNMRSEELDKAARKADEEAERRRNLRKPIGGKLDKLVKDVQGDSLEKQADKVIKDVQGEDNAKAEADARREKLKAKFGGRQGRIQRKAGDMAADDLMAMDGNKRAAKRMINRGKIADAKQEGEANKNKEGKDDSKK